MSIPVSPGRIRWALLCLALVAFTAMPVASAGARPAKLEVIVQREAGHSAAPVIAEVRRSGGRVIDRLPIVNGFAARLPAGAAASLQRSEGVRAVTRNAAVEPQSVSTSRLQSAYPTSIDARNHSESQASGRGIGVAVIDTGIAGRMPDFSVKGESRDSRVTASVVTNPDATSWSAAGGDLAADFARSSWSCLCDPEAAGEDVSTTRSSWSRSSWSRSSWSMSWNK